LSNRFNILIKSLKVKVQKLKQQYKTKKKNSFIFFAFLSRLQHFAQHCGQVRFAL